MDPTLLVDNEVEEVSEEEDEETPQNGTGSSSSNKGNKKKKVDNPWTEVTKPQNKLARNAPSNNIFTAWYPRFTELKPGPKNINLERVVKELYF